MEDEKRIKKRKKILSETVILIVSQAEAAVHYEVSTTPLVDTYYATTRDLSAFSSKNILRINSPSRSPFRIFKGVL